MVDTILKSWKELSDDAFGQTAINFHKAVEVIDKKLGENYAKTHPELIGAFLQATSIEYNGTTIGSCIQYLEQCLKEASQVIAGAIEEIKN